MSETALPHPSPASILQQQDWPTLEDHLNHHGYAIIPGLFSRRQSRVEVVPSQQGDAVIFAVQHKPATGTRGIYRTHLRHVVSGILSGHRHTLGMILHNAEK